MNQAPMTNRAGNAIKRGYQGALTTGKKLYADKTARMIIGIITALVILGVLIYVIIALKKRADKHNDTSPMIVGAPIDMNRKKTYTAKLAPSQYGLEFTFSMWVYVADWDYKYGETKNILHMGNDKQNQFAPKIFLGPTKNQLFTRINTHADINEGCIVDNFPLQKWVHIIYVLNNRTVDIYIDGKLERSCVLKGIPILNKGPLHLGLDGGYYGKLAKLQYFSRALGPDEAYEIYTQGPNVDSKYNVSLFSDGKFLDIEKDL